MQKEKLTRDKIKADLKRNIKKNVSAIVVYVILSVFLLLITYFIYSYSSNYFKILTYLFGFMTAVVFVVTIVFAIQTIKLYKIFNKTSCIVKDKLIGKEIKEYYTRRGLEKYYYFYFSGYGEYRLSGEYYKWSQNFNMWYDGLYRQSDCGDEFYLVLTKRHTGKILSVYSTQMFQMEEQEADK